MGSMDNKSTILDYVVMLIRRDYPAAASLPEELSAVAEASKLGLQVLEGMVNALAAMVAGIAEDVNKACESMDESDVFVSRAPEFVDDASALMQKLKGDVEVAKTQFADMAMFLGVPKAKVAALKPEETLSVIATFNENFKKAFIKLEKAAKEAARAKKLAKAKKKKGKKNKGEEDEGGAKENKAAEIGKAARKGAKIAKGAGGKDPIDAH